MSLEQEIIELKQIVAKHEELYKAIVNALSAHEVVANLATNMDKVFEQLTLDFMDDLSF